MREGIFGAVRSQFRGGLLRKNDAKREKYIKWVFADNFGRLDWETRHRIASLYLRRNEKILPAELKELDSARLVDHFQQLFIIHMSTVGLARQILNAEMYHRINI